MPPQPDPFFGCMPALRTWPQAAGLRIVDSHTEGEPTRVVISGGPDLGRGPVAEQLGVLRRQHDDLRRSLILEPRGHEAIVGALLCPSADTSCDIGVIFFNNTGYLGMCGHGAIGVAVTLAFLGREPGDKIRLETPVGAVNVELGGRNEATVENVPGFMLHDDVAVRVDGYPPLQGDVAWGGNWFFIAELPADAPHLALRPERIPELTSLCRKIKSELRAAGITGADGAGIDHIELTSPAGTAGVDSRNFVLCPGDAYDRSPCGTGTSAKLACLAARGALTPGETWVQESITGGRFLARYRIDDQAQVVASSTGRAFVTADATIVRDDDDPFRDGMPGP